MARVAIALATLSSLIVGLAAASAQPQSRSTAVRYDDLNLATPVAIAELHRRLVNAAAQVCGVAVPAGVVSDADVRRCRRAAVRNADAAVLVAVDRARRGTFYADMRLAAADR